MSIITSNQQNRYLFDIKNYKVVQEVNKGGFAVINLVENKQDGSKYAAKTNLIQNTKQNKLFILREVRILIEVQHPTIIQFRGFSYIDFDNKKNITILMDYMKNGSLAYLLSNEEKGLSPSNYNNTKRQIILIGVARGMKLLHKLHIIHRDLKPENILLDEDLYPHITDFGLSKFFDPNHSMSQSMAELGTLAYMAPEVILSERFNTKADVYSFGILMYEILTGQRAYQKLLHGKKKLSTFQFKQKICEGLRPEISPGMMKKSHQKMIEKCLSENPKNRPSFSELYKKLSLSADDFIDLGLDVQTESDVIDYDDDDDENSDDEFGINKTFCLENVDYDEVLCYVDRINDDTKPNYNNNEDIEQMKQTIKKLEKITAEQSSTIDLLKEKLDDQLKNNEKLKLYFTDQLNQLKTQIKEITEKSNPIEEVPAITKISAIDKSPTIVKSSTVDKSHIITKIVLSDVNAIKVGGNTNPDFPIENVFKLDNSYFYNYFGSFEPSVNDSYIQFDFGYNKKIRLISYFIQSNQDKENSYHPCTWRIEGSNNEIQWDILDRQENCSYLNGKYRQYTFQCKQNTNKSYRFIRYVQENSWCVNYSYRIYITRLDLNGYLS